MTEKELMFRKEIEIQFPSLGVQLFDSASSVKKWAENERDFWQSIHGRIQSHDLFRGNFTIHDLIQRADHLVNMCDSFMASGNVDIRNSMEQKIVSDLRVYENTSVLISDTSDGRLIDHLSETAPAAAWIAIVHARKQEYQASYIQNFSEFMRAWDILRLQGLDVRKRLESLEDSLKSMRTRWTKRLDRTNKMGIREQNRTRRRVRLYRRAAQRLFAIHSRQLEEHKTRMGQMEKEFSTDMRLRASEKFWSRKRELNRKRAKSAFTKLCVVGSVGGTLLALVYWGLYAGIGLSEGLSIVHALLYSIPAILLLWLLKIFANEYRSNHHLADDAEERVAMIFTFKALEHEERVGFEERLLILNALFRPHERGSEDSIPMPAWDAMINRLSKPSGSGSPS